jgi:hypothetical protein
MLWCARRWRATSRLASWVLRVAGLRYMLASDAGDQGGSQVGASASATVLNVYVDGRQVDDVNAERAAARAMMEKFRYRSPELQPPSERPGPQDGKPDGHRNGFRQ